MPSAQGQMHLQRIRLQQPGGSSAGDETKPEREGLCLMLQWGFNAVFSTTRFPAADPSAKGSPSTQLRHSFPFRAALGRLCSPSRTCWGWSSLQSLRSPRQQFPSRRAGSHQQTHRQKISSKGQMQRVTLKQVQMQQTKIKPKIHSATPL